MIDLSSVAAGGTAIGRETATAKGAITAGRETARKVTVGDGTAGGICSPAVSIVSMSTVGVAVSTIFGFACVHYIWFCCYDLTGFQIWGT